MEMSPEQLAMLKAHGAPYPSTIASVGGMPTSSIDVPILSVFIVLYALSAAGNMTTFQINRRKGHKFLPNALLFGFSMARILTCALRIGLAYHSQNVSLALAANIFLTAGILIVYIVNLLFAQRVLRAKQPTLGWSIPLKVLFALLYALVGIFLILIIVFIVYQSYSLNPHWHHVTRNIQLGASTYFVILTAAPILIVALAYALPASGEEQHFGTRGSTASKAMVVSVSAMLCLLGAAFKSATTWEAPRPVDDPAWYQGKACLYVFYFALEVAVLAWFLVMRVDQRFWVPDGASKRRSFVVVEEKAERSRPQTAAEGRDGEGRSTDGESEKASEV